MRNTLILLLGRMTSLPLWLASKHVDSTYCCTYVMQYSRTTLHLLYNCAYFTIHMSKNKGIPPQARRHGSLAVCTVRHKYTLTNSDAFNVPHLLSLKSFLLLHVPDDTTSWCIRLTVIWAFQTARSPSLSTLFPAKLDSLMTMFRNSLFRICLFNQKTTEYLAHKFTTLLFDNQ